MTAINLASLDCTRPLELSATIWAANIAALRDEQPEFATQLEHVSLPDGWRPVAGLDGWPTFRLEKLDEPARWLAGTAAPRTRADALLRYPPLAGKNPALPTIAAGTELHALLRRLTRQQAVYVFEENLAQLAAVLRTVDFSPQIRDGRCILVPSADQAGFLEHLLDHHPGLLPPGSIVALPGTSAEQLSRLRGVCEQVALKTGQARDSRLRVLVDTLAGRQQAAAEPSLACVALGPDVMSHRLSHDLAVAAGELGWSACACVCDTARHAHVLPHCEQIAQQAPALTVFVDVPPACLPLRAGQALCQWHLDVKRVPDSLPDDGVIHLAASPRVMDALRAAGVTSDRRHALFWGYTEPAADEIVDGESARESEETEAQLSVAKGSDTDLVQSDTLAAESPQEEIAEPTISSPESPSSEAPIPACTASEHAAAAVTTAGRPYVLLIGDLPDASAAACHITQPTHKQLWAALHATAANAWETPDITQPVTLLRAGERASKVELDEPGLRRNMLRIIEHVLIPLLCSKESHRCYRALAKS